MQSKLGLAWMAGAIAFVFSIGTVHADEEAEIVTTCHFANMEWGNDMIDRCVKENRATREVVLAYPAQHQSVVKRCRRNSELGWTWVKDCVDRDIEAAAALASYPQEKAELIAACEREFKLVGAVKVKGCVDEAGEAPRKN